MRENKPDIELLESEFETFLLKNNCFKDFKYNLSNNKGSQWRGHKSNVVFHAYVCYIIDQCNGHPPEIKYTRATIGNMVNIAFTWDYDPTRSNGEDYWYKIHANWRDMVTDDFVRTRLIKSVKYNSIWQ